MANVKISGLPTASTPLTGAELVPVVQSGVTSQTTVSDFGAAVSYTPSGTGAVATTVQTKLRETVSVKDFGAVGDGVTDDTAAIQAAINANLSGATIWFPKGVYKTSSPIIWPSGIHLTADGWSGDDRTTYSAKIINSTSDIFTTVGATIVGGQKISGLRIESSAGGGHIFVMPAISRFELYNCNLIQQNTNKCVLYSVGTLAQDLGYFGNWWHHFEFSYNNNATISPIYIQNATINQNTFENFRCNSGQNTATGTYAFWIESVHTGAPALNTKISQGTFEQPGGGMVNLLSCSFSTLEQISPYDLTVIPANPLINIATSGTGGQPSQNNTLKDVWIDVGNSSVPDVKIDTTATGGGSTYLLAGKIGVLDGNDTSGTQNKLVNSNTIINTVQKAAINSYNANGIYLTGTSPALMTSFSISRGTPGNYDGYLLFSANGSYVGTWTYSGEFRLGSNPVAPKHTFATSGRYYSNGQIYPGTPALAQQTATGLSGGTGAPNNADGSNGDFYFRSDGTAGTSIYMKRAGAWVGIV